MVQGYSLVEVLVALFILSVGLLGIAGLQITALNTVRNAYFQSIATVQMMSMLNRLRANSKTDWPRELQQWNQVNRRLLPQGQGEFACSGSRDLRCSVTLTWHAGKSETATMETLL